MSRRKPVRIFLFLLGLWIAFLPAVTGPRVATMSAMEMSQDDATGGCDPCPAADGNAQMCRFLCLSVAPFVMSAEPMDVLPVMHETYGREPGSFLPGHLPSLDPAPPRTSLR